MDRLGGSSMNSRNEPQPLVDLGLLRIVLIAASLVMMLTLLLIPNGNSVAPLVLPFQFLLEQLIPMSGFYTGDLDLFIVAARMGMALDMLFYCVILVWFRSLYSRLHRLFTVNNSGKI